MKTTPIISFQFKYETAESLLEVYTYLFRTMGVLWVAPVFFREKKRKKNSPLLVSITVGGLSRFAPAIKEAVESMSGYGIHKIVVMS